MFRGGGSPYSVGLPLSVCFTDQRVLGRYRIVAESYLVIAGIYYICPYGFLLMLLAFHFNHSN